jgi:hypothetical protein
MRISKKRLKHGFEKTTLKNTENIKTKKKTKTQAYKKEKKNLKKKKKEISLNNKLF